MKSVSLVTLSDDGSIRIEERTTSIAQFERISVDTTGIDDWQDIVSTLGRELERARNRASAEHLIVRLSVTGKTSLAWRIRRDSDLLKTEADEHATVIGSCWVEKLEVDCRTADTASETGGDPVAELRHLIMSDVAQSESYSQEANRIAQELIRQLPQELRDFLGSNENSFQETLEALAAEGAEDALRHDDIVTTSRISHAAEVAELNQKSQTLALAEADLETEDQGRDTAAGELSDVLEKIGTAICAMTPSLPKDMSLPQLETWLAEREKVLESFTEIKKADREIEAAEKDGKRIRSKLIEALRAVGIDSEPDEGVDTLRSLAQEMIDRETELETLHAEVNKEKHGVDVRTRKVEREKKIDKNWTRRWEKLCTDCWLGNEGTIPSIPTVREILKALDELAPLVKKRTNLADRIKKMENDQHKFSTKVDSLAKQLRADETLPPLELYAQLKNTVDEAMSAQKKHEDTSGRLQDAEERRQDIEKKRKIHSSHKTEMLEHFKVDSLSEVDAKLRELEERNNLKKQEVTVEREILELLGVQSTEVAEDLLDNVDRNAVNNEIAELEGRFDNQDQLTRELFSDQKQAEKRIEAIGGDDTVAKIEEKRKLAMLEIEDGAVRYLRLRLGITAAERALQIYRDRHRSSMMTRASDAFRMISRGAYKELKTQPEKDSEVLIAVGANGGSKIVSALSKGTRFQLYLALRVAGYHEFVQSRRPVPFIADDIMETFDDFRAEEAFRLFAGMAETGQIIYLTHHKHLCEIARKVCPEVQVYELEPPQ